MYYIFNPNNICIGICNIEPNVEDLNTRNEFIIQSDEEYSIGSLYENSVITETVITEDYEKKARTLRDSLRLKIDKYLLPASTIEDVLVTEEQRNVLIQDSLLLAKWPTTENWPYISLPTLSDMCSSLIAIPMWSYPEQATTY